MDVYERVYAACEPRRGESQWDVSVKLDPADWDPLDPDSAQTIRDDAAHAALKATGCNVKVCGEPTKAGGTITIHWRDGTSGRDPCREDLQGGEI